MHGHQLPRHNARRQSEAAAYRRIEAPSFKAVDLGGRASSLVLADLLPGARVVKAFNHLGAALLQSDPQSEGGRLARFPGGPLPVLNLVEFG